ncbi:hypothetical protein Tco_1045866 [Tanacetum coccineum]|uniref:Uncharacterized protein n=1 Tax=Tanacetum coccineum TaxID=301880 RepID=A0ABQ5GU23_9ASTR
MRVKMRTDRAAFDVLRFAPSISKVGWYSSLRAKHVTLPAKDKQILAVAYNGSGARVWKIVVVLLSKLPLLSSHTSAYLCWCSGSWISMVQDIPAKGAISTLLCELVHERLLWTSEDFVWPADSTIHGRIIIDVEFPNLLVYSVYVEEASSIWPNYRMLRSSASESILRCLSSML